MNMRRTLATLAATIVVAPAVLIAAPAAVAQPAAATPVAADPFASCAQWTVTDERTTSELVGFPTRLVAGTWSAFTFRTVNTSASPLKAVGANVDASASASDTYAELKITTQWYDKAAKKWQTMPHASKFATIGGTLKPGARADVKMRVRADVKSKAGQGFAFDYGRYAGKDGVCGFARTIHEYDFEVVPAAPAPKPVTR
ncbi:hypothetical protein J7F03_24480 [Streptomyces sp. ISL-43]|uniref:hypothetical protein n=1 Tax=Streptomyces sp. ISL-43 TaxID=2819183 RepID=UPI001BEACFC8|nr:hypothetical protein [Streptomyces sp. ISL-43]MBT2450176.1 hypothetical protein [Streptomyces sp. ISL-43]